MRSVYLVIFFCIVSLSSFAQFGNQWIDFNQPYFKIPVAKEGIYRLNYNDLQAAGFPLSGDPKKIQLYHRGVEQAIFIEGEGDAQFDPSDFLEFYGKKNDGTLDEELYQPASAQPHKYYNLYSDTTSYFLTVGLTDGKRMIEFYEPNTTSLPAEAHHLGEKMLLLTNEFATGFDANELYNSFYDVGEGFTSVQIFQGQSVSYTLDNIIQTVPAGGVPELEALFVGRGNMGHAVEVYVGTSLRLLTSFTFSGTQAHKIAMPIQWTDISGDGKLTVQVKINGVGGQPDRVSVSYVKLTFPQALDAAMAAEKFFTLSANVGDKSFVEIANPLAGSRLFDVTDSNNVVQVGGTVSSTFDAVVPATSSQRRLYFSNVTAVPTIKPVSFRKLTAGQADYIIISHPLLRKPALGYSDPVAAYGAYRASPEGGSYDTLIVNMQQLYDQFSYGETTPVAIFRFLKFLTAANTPKYLLLIGKGLDVWYKYNRNPGGFTAYKDLVPAAGFPASDMTYSAGLSGTEYEPAIPTGRIPAMKAEQVAGYLNKVKEMDALPFDNLWRKNLLHLSGGREEGEPEQLKSYLADLQTKAEDFHLGGKVSALAKYSKEIQLINVSKQVNEGVNLITFFGHSAAQYIDFDIGYASDPVMGYNNKGKYPTLLMNGCNLGSYFLTEPTFGEDWVLAKDKGAAAFIGHSWYGFTHLLKRYSDFFYGVGYQDSTYIHKGIGDIQKETAKRYMVNTAPTVENITQVQQMVLLGDPALKLFGATKADLEINDDNISIQSLDGQPVTAQTESFAVKFIVRNFGQAKPDTIRVEVVRTLNDNSTIVYDSLYPAPKYSDTLLFIIKKGREKAFGNNSFRLTLDPDNILSELTKENNSAIKNFNVPLNGTKNLFPSNYAIVNSPTVNLSFQATNLLSDEREFILELDTINSFDSPFKKQWMVKGKVLARQSIELHTADTLAYYWRTKLKDPLQDESLEWTQSSFTFIKDGPEGWAQVHFPQYLENESIGLIGDGTSRTFNFKATVTDVDITTFGSNHTAAASAVSVKINNEEYNLAFQGYGCRDNSISMIAFDKNSATPYIGVKFKWYNRGGRACGREPWVINNYVPGDMVTGDGFDMIQFVNNVQEGDSVVLFNIGDAQYSAWPAAVRTKVGELGVSTAQLDALQPGEPVVIFGRKGSAPGTAKIFRSSSAPGDLQELTVGETITGHYSSGSMNSSLIGPADNWQFLESKIEKSEANDIVSFSIVGVNLEGDEEIIFENAIGSQDLSAIDANEFPYLKIRLNLTDEFNLTAPQLNHWIVAFTPVAEGIVIFNGEAEQPELNEGVEWQEPFGFVNISNKAFSDSLTVTYEVFNQTFNTSTLKQKKIKSPLPGDTTDFIVDVQTLNKSGLNDVTVFVNPKILPEQYYDNNVLQFLDFLSVKKESLNPVLDVSIDGRYIENGDLVSPNPLIVIKVWDENKSIIKQDTVGIKVYLTYPCASEECDPTRISLTDEHIKWYPATSTEPFRIEFTPPNLSNGEYTLRVEAEDARNNSSGDNPFEIAFKIDRASAIQISEPYPNPVTDLVYFNVLISGEVLPTLYEVQLLNVNGKQVGYFGSKDSPTFHIGSNEVTWDGLHTLPSGVYIYKIIVVLNNQRVEKVGKMVLLRKP